MQQPEGQSVTGRMAIHKIDITSTRCEVHALMAGLIATGDCGQQVCDNQSAIQIFNRARKIANGDAQPKYRDPHRIEIRSLQRLMHEHGTMVPKWVRSHQEHVATDDMSLQQQRSALAVVDTAAERPMNSE
ncbi:hypothetical protein GN244_ATG15435 [Phytophthora infestans]|uniref:RNase H type-1 domain-containing protein n=1 Tax=Phytophthora infestans TaxID=4787 RepID=A0A833SJ78_PHYIN|nr:hypothetical protein GN244_ATG15435 [Phytophthora infestans]KAF4138311.1 hypothetical protein GN958_ATG12465 [Phytophthora infestans]